MRAARALTPLTATESADGSFEVRRGEAGNEFEISSDSIQDGEEIAPQFIYGRHDPSGENKHPHLALKGLRDDGSTCGVVIIHDKIDLEKWCHGVLIVRGNREITEGMSRRRRQFLGVIEGINDLHRNERGESHNTTQERDQNGKGYIGSYPGYDKSKTQANQETHVYRFDGYEVQMTVLELLFAVAQITRRKLGDVLLETADNYTETQLLKIAVLTKENVEEAIAGHVIGRSSFTGTYTNPGWHLHEWVGPKRPGDLGRKTTLAVNS